jgi:Subtilase family
MGIVERYGESYRDDQLAVDLSDVPLVMRELLALDVVLAYPGPPLASDALGLALIDLSNLAAGIRPLRDDPDLVAAAAAARPVPYKREDALPDLDLLLFALRQRFRAAYDGWVPTIGKNRPLAQVEGWPYIKGASGVLKPVDGPRIPPRSGTPGPRVGILDTRIFAHPDLAGRFTGDTVATLTPPSPSTLGHATFVAGLILRRAPGADLVVRAVLDDEGSNDDSWDVATKIVAFGGAGVPVLNLSFGCATVDREPPLVLRRAIERLGPDVVVVAAAGNHGDLGPDPDPDTGLTGRTPMWPAALDGVVAVGAYDGTDPAHPRAGFSPHGAPWVDLLAPGVDEESTYLVGDVNILERQGGKLAVEETREFAAGYAAWRGTSFAAANVTGQLAALMAGGRTAREALAALPGADIVAPAPDEER